MTFGSLARDPLSAADLALCRELWNDYAHRCPVTERGALAQFASTLEARLDRTLRGCAVCGSLNAHARTRHLKGVLLCDTHWLNARDEIRRDFAEQIERIEKRFKTRHRKLRRGARKESRRLRFQILQRDEFTCVYCGRRPPEVTLHVDHIVPVSKGGDDSEENLVTACRDCNLGKHTREIAA